MKIYLISILILVTSLGNNPKEDNEYPKINGIVKNYYSDNPISFMRMDLYFNDTLTISTMSDFDGNFVINLDRKINENDLINIKFKYANDFSKKINLKNTLLKDLVFHLKTDTNLTREEKKKWRSKIHYRCGTKDESEEEFELFDFELDKKP